MTSIRLPAEYEQKLDQISKNENMSKTEVIKRALKTYFDKYEKQISAFELGKDLFGKYGSGKNNLSKNHKKLIKEKVRAKFSH